MALTPGEKRDLARNIQKGMTVICSSIAQLHLASPDPAATRDDTGIITSLRQLGNNQWKFTNIEGALLLVRDPAGYCFFKIYDMDKYKLRFHYELYDNLEYKSLSPNFHAFEMEGCVCGFNFSSKDVAHKFLNRVQKTIPRSVAGVGSTAPQDPSMLFSPGFRKGPPLPSRRQDTPPKEKRNTTVTEASSNSGNSLQPSKTKSDVYTSNSNLYLETGLLDAENIPLEWKRILKNAGIRKKDLKDPTMQEIIKQTLEQYNISIQPPPLDLDNEAVRKYYTPAQLLEYEKYKKEMAQYEQELDKYNKEMQEYQEFQKRQERLDAWAKNNRVTTMSGDEGLKNLRNSVMLFQGKGVSNLLPEMELENVMKPRMSMNKPYLPALPVIPEANEVEKESTVERSSRGKKGQKKKDKAPKRKDSNLERMEKLGGMMSERSSKLIIKADFLKDIKKNNIQLKHVSVLPDLSGMKKDDKAGLLHALITRIQDRRQFLEDDKSSDSGEFSDPDE